jgi:hypothetical protein
LINERTDAHAVVTLSSGLRDSLILLLATAALTGLLAPLVIGIVQTRNQRRLKSFEADIARQTKIIDDQVSFLDRFADALWTYQLLLIAPLYYGQFGMHSSPTPADQEATPYVASRSDYFTQSSLQLGTIRAEIGKAVRLVPMETWNLLKDLYYKQLLQLDLDVTRLLVDGPNEANASRWQTAQERVLVELAGAIDQIVERLADDFSLKAPPKRS